MELIFNYLPDQFIFIFILSPVTCFACIPVFMSILALSRIKDNLLFVYLKLEVIFIFVDCLTSTFTFLAACDTCFPSLNRYFICVFDFYILNFLSATIEMASLLMSIFAALSFLLVFDSSSNPSGLAKLFLKLKPIYCAYFAFGLSALTFSYQLFASIPFYKLEEAKNINQSENFDDWTYELITPVPSYPPETVNLTYVCDWNLSFKSPLNRIFVIVSFLLSYGLLVIALIFINGCIVYKVRKSFGEKSIMVGKKSENRRKSKKNKLTKLIFLDSCNLIISRFPNMIYYSFGVFYNFNEMQFPFSSFATLMMFISYHLKFVIFYKVNLKFRTESQRIFLSACGLRSVNFKRLFRC